MSPTHQLYQKFFICSFSFGGTKIRYWPTALNHLVRLKALDMSHNVVTFMREGAVSAFADTLQELRLVNASLSPFQAELSKLKALTLLDLSYNSIVDIPPGALTNMSFTLKKLTMSHAHLSYLPEALYELNVLEELDLSFNPMQSTNADIIGTSDNSLLRNSAATLRFVNLSSCGLNAIPRAVVNLDQLEVLDLSRNRIVVLNNHQFSSLPHLRTLLLNDNPLMSIPCPLVLNKMMEKSINSLLFGVTAVQTKLWRIDGGEKAHFLFHTLYSCILQLDLSSNQITRIPDVAFPGAPKLSAVDLSNNSLVYIFDYAFTDAHSVRTLRLSRCSLTRLPSSLSQADGLRTVFVDGNPIPCDCDLSWILTWQRQSGIIPNIVGRCADHPTMTISTYVSTRLQHDCGSVVG
uniref:LRRCT domain-containing protein n=1 Tax=Biomphalaria glabrata TaxID=6526 RepID=A0A2C9KW19_BIOGL